MLRYNPHQTGKKAFDQCPAFGGVGVAAFVQHGPQGKYPVDCRVNHMVKPLFVFAVNNDDKYNVSTINMLQYEKWGLEFKSLAIFEDQEEISRKVLARVQVNSAFFQFRMPSSH
jgi:hypothetical protein